MEKAFLEITDSLIHHKQGLTTSDVRYIKGNFVVKLCGLKTDNHFKIQNYI